MAVRNIRFQNRRYTNDQWASKTLEAGEIGFNTTNKELRIGTAAKQSWANAHPIVTRGNGEAWDIKAQGTGSVAGGVNPVHLGYMDWARANRFAFMPNEQVTWERSEDNGATWKTFTQDAATTSTFFTSAAATNVYLPAGTPTVEKNTTNYWLRITVDAWKPSTTTNERYFARWATTCIWVSTNGVSGLQVLIEKANIGSNTTWSTVKSWTALTGWNGANDIGHTAIVFGGATSQTNQAQKVRFTFKCTGFSSGKETARPSIQSIAAYGELAYSVPNNLARRDHLYSWDTAQTMLLPGSMKLGANKILYGDYTLTVPSKTGTIALTSDIKDTNTAHSHSAGDGLTVSGAGGTTGDTKYSHAVPTGATAKAYSGGKITGITTDKFGHVTAVTTGTDTDTNSAHAHTAGVGLVISGSGGTSGTTDYKVALVNEAKSGNAASYTAGGTSKFYAVQLDKNGKLGTYVPWTDTNTDTKVTAVGNHYDPAEDTNAQLSAAASSTTAASWNSTSLVTGVKVKRDAKGHVTGITVDSIKMPANPNTNTTYTLSINNSALTLTPSSGNAQTVQIRCLQLPDTRSEAINPSTLPTGVYGLGLKSGTTVNISGVSGYSGVVSVKQWSDASGGQISLLAFNDKGVYHLYADQKDTTIKSANWKKLAFETDVVTRTGGTTSSPEAVTGVKKFTTYKLGDSLWTYNATTKSVELSF